MFDLQMKSLRDYVKAFNRHDAKAISALYSEEAAFVERGEFVSAGCDSIRANYQGYFDAFPDAATTITRSWHWGDAVLFEYVEGGTHTGPHRAHSKPTGKKSGYVGASFLRFRPDGLIKADTTFSDELTKEVQVGWAPGPLGKMEVRPVLPVPAATDTWDVHKVTESDPAKAKANAARTSLYTKFSLRSEKDFLAALSDDVVLSPFDDPKDAKGKREAAALFKDWMKTFSDGVVDATDGWTADGYVVLLGTFTGKHVGAWGPLKPTNKTFTSHFLDIAKVKDDKVEHLWSYANNYELLKHLGYQKDEVTIDLARDPMSPR
jgi:ketosteroid isomerase-like protein